MELGDNCHFKQGAIPAAAITDLEGNVLISNTLIEETDTIPLGGNIYVSAGEVWAVSSVKILHTRFWAASTASIILTCAVPALNKFPPPVPEKLKIQKEICIWLGYLDVVKGASKQDFIDGRLIRKFVGVIDSINATGSANGGFSIKLQARCRMSWLMDSTVSYNQTEMEGLGNGAGSISRSKLILEIAQRAIGQVALEECVNCGKTINESPDFTEDLEIVGDAEQLASADVWYSKADYSLPNYEEEPLAGYTRSSSLKVNPNPEFRIYTSRVAIEQEQSRNFLLADQGPIEMIKALSLQEVYPTEVFSSYADGHLYYVPRANDGSSLKDPKRFYRTYYFRYNFEGININQRMLTFREEASSNSLKTNFIVSKEGQNTDGSPYKSWSLHLRVKPTELIDAEFPCKMQHLKDPTIKTLGQAATVAVSAARIQAKSLRSGMVIVVGDPSLTPGEIVQTIGSPLLKNGGLDNAELDRKTFIEYNERYNELILEYAKKAATEDADEKELELPLYDGSTAKFKRDEEVNSKSPKLICDVTSSIINSNNKIGFNPTPQTIWRIEAVLDKWNAGSKGYTTELMLIDPF